MTQGVQKQVGPLPAVKPEFHLLEVGREMLGRNLMPGADHAALKQRECRFNRIGVNVAFHINLELVANRLMSAILANVASGAAIGIEVICKENIHILADVLLDEFAECPGLHILSVEESQFAAALTDADNDFLIVPTVVFPLIAIHAAHKCFVHLYLAREHWTVSLHHGVPNAMAEVPRGFIAHSNGSLNLTGRNTFLRLTEQKSRKKPCFEREMRIVENRARRDRELIVAILAIEELLVGFQFDRWHFAARAFRAGRPAEPDQQFAALVIGRKQSVYVN